MSSPSSAREREWTPCTEKCKHRSPYRIYYRSGHTALINTEGCARAGWALQDPALVEKVLAPHA